MKRTIAFLRKDEWTMGNGQCHICCGKKPRIGWWTDTVGHQNNCELAHVLVELGQKVEWERKNHSKSVRDIEKLFTQMDKND